jgi:hypothetical protein
MGMYVRRIKRKNKDGSEVEYIQLAHNTRHPEKGYTRAEVIYSFGRRDQLDVAALKRLVSSLSRFISPEDAQELEAQGTGIKFISSRPAGGAILLRGLWKRIGIDQCLAGALKGREFTTPVGDAIFAMVANRALANPNTRGMICLKSLSDWPLPGKASLSGVGYCPATRMMPSVSTKSRRI